MNTPGRFITAVETQNTGGNCMADVIRLVNGSVVVITDDCMAVYDRASDWDGDEDGEGTCVEGSRLVAWGPFARRGDDEPLTFIRCIDTDELDGPVTTDLVTLNDGRVVGIDADLLVLYPNRTAFDAITDAELGPVADGAPAVELLSMMETGCPECARSFGPWYVGPCDH